MHLAMTHNEMHMYKYIYASNNLVVIDLRIAMRYFGSR